jgi:GcrA cell cycle regulator
MTWTDERVETLKRLWTDGLSASQIAAELGGITRNAVIGKVHRLGLSGRAKSPSSAAPRPRHGRPHGPKIRGSRPAAATPRSPMPMTSTPTPSRSSSTTWFPWVSAGPCSN